MENTSKAISNGWSAERVVKLLLIAVVITSLALIGYFVADRFRPKEPSKLDRDLQQVEEAVLRDPQNASARVAAGEAYLAKKMYDQSLAEFQDALKIDEKQPWALLGLGTLYQRMGNTDKMVETYDRLVKLVKNKDTSVSDIRLEVAYYYLGQVYLQRGQYDLAIERLKDAVAINRTDADALLLLGNAMQAKGQDADAIKVYRSAVMFVPDFGDAYQGMARSFDTLGDSAHAGYARAMVAYSGGDKAGGLKQMEVAAASISDDAEVFWALGLLREENGHKESAVEAYRRALAIEPNHGLAKEALKRLGAQ